MSHAHPKLNRYVQPTGTGHNLDQFATSMVIDLMENRSTERGRSASRDRFAPRITEYDHEYEYGLEQWNFLQCDQFRRALSQSSRN